jgi:hypothetical protein
MRVLIGTACAVAGLVVGCDKSTDGEAVRAEGPAASSTTSATGTTSSEPPTTGMPAPGVIETSRAPLEPKAKTCDPLPPGPAPGTQHVSFVNGASPATPIIEVVAPEKWTFAVDQGGSPVMTGTGPDGMTGTLTVTPTDLGPAAAFDKYADDVAAKADFSSINLRPADFCGYSGQELFGTLSDPPGPPTYFADRIAHVWTNTKDYLVAVHLQGPKEDPQYDEAKTALMGDFAVVIP